MCYCPTPTLHLNLALTGDGAFLLSPQKTHSVWFISILNYGDTENVLINHLLLVIPMSYPCHYTNLCPHKPHKHAHTHAHTHTHTHIHTHTHTHSALRNDLCFGPSRVTEIALLSRWHKSISDSLHFSLYKHQHVSAGNCWQLWRAHRVKKRKQKYTSKSNVKEWRRVRSALKNR